MNHWVSKLIYKKCVKPQCGENKVTYKIYSTTRYCNSRKILDVKPDDLLYNHKGSDLGEEYNKSNNKTCFEREPGLAISYY